MIPKKVGIRVNKRQITEDGNYQPIAPIWQFVNTGGVTMRLDGNYYLRPGESFGVGVEAVVGAFLAKGIKVENETIISVEFLFSPTSKLRASAHLVETFISLK